MGRIYSDLRGEIITWESGQKVIYLYADSKTKEYYSPSLVLYNPLMVQYMITYLHGALAKMNYKEIRDEDVRANARKMFGITKKASDRFTKEELQIIMNLREMKR